MQIVTTIGIDIAKSVFQVHGVDAAGRVATLQLTAGGSDCSVGLLGVAGVDEVGFAGARSGAASGGTEGISLGEASPSRRKAALRPAVPSRPRCSLP